MAVSNQISTLNSVCLHAHYNYSIYLYVYIIWGYLLEPIPVSNRSMSYISRSLVSQMLNQEYWSSRVRIWKIDWKSELLILTTKIVMLRWGKSTAGNFSSPMRTKCFQFSQIPFTKVPYNVIPVMKFSSKVQKSL